MSNLTQTAANVALGSSARTETAQAGSAITQGQPVYQLTTDGKWYPSDANVAAAQTGSTAIALTPASTNGYFVLVRQQRALINLGATLVKGTTYVVSATAGAICPQADLIAGDGIIVLGVASTTALLDLQITATGIVL